MNADQVVEKILADAQTEADKIVSESNKELEKIKASAEDKMQKFQQETEQMAKDAAEDKSQRMMAAARMDAAKQMLATKREMINDVFDKASQAIVNLDDQAYLELIEKLMTKSVETGDEQIILAEGETKITSDFVKELNRKLGSGYKGNLKIADEKCKGQAGFMLKRGNVSTNVTLDVLLQQARTELETKISSELFATS